MYVIVLLVWLIHWNISMPCRLCHYVRLFDGLYNLWVDCSIGCWFATRWWWVCLNIECYQFIHYKTATVRSYFDLWLIIIGKMLFVAVVGAPLLRILFLVGHVGYDREKFNQYCGLFSCCQVRFIPCQIGSTVVNSKSSPSNYSTGIGRCQSPWLSYFVISSGQLNKCAGSCGLLPNFKH